MLNIVEHNISHVPASTITHVLISSQSLHHSPSFCLFEPFLFMHRHGSLIHIQSSLGRRVTLPTFAGTAKCILHRPKNGPSYFLLRPQTAYFSWPQSVPFFFVLGRKLETAIFYFRFAGNRDFGIQICDGLIIMQKMFIMRLHDSIKSYYGCYI